ncbi:MAG: LysR family transcriptional regulator [Tannerellaceae bacterium]|jgi:molybdate transport system regulatory protein|nr:LysR family transcriptional regulator [Tannerellaceae bacterium]
MEKKKKKTEFHIFSVVSDFEIYKDGARFLTPRIMDLVRAVHETGSILAASKEVHIAYPKAWNMLNTLNRAAALPVVIRNHGGEKGGGTLVTPFGLKLLHRFDKLQASYDKFILNMEEGIQDLCSLPLK